MSVGGGQMQPEWVELDARIVERRDACADAYDRGDMRAARVEFEAMQQRIAERSPAHVAFIEQQKGLR